MSRRVTGLRVTVCTDGIGDKRTRELSRRSTAASFSQKLQVHCCSGHEPQRSTNDVGSAAWVAVSLSSVRVDRPMTRTPAITTTRWRPA